MSADETGDRFDEIDLDDYETDRIRLSTRVVVGAVGLLGLLGLFLYDVYLVQGGPVVGGWDPSQVDWLTLLTAVLVVTAVGVPIAQEPALLKRFWKRYPKDVSSLLALAFVLAFVFVGTFGPVITSVESNFAHAQEPPYGTSLGNQHFYTCVGQVRNGQCHGTLQYPLGTTRSGVAMTSWLAYGTRTALQFTLVAIALMVPVALLFGTVAAYYGGWVEEALMRYVDVQQSVPTVIVYFVFIFLFGPTLFWLIVAYALFNWADVAQVIHSEAASEREHEYFMAARSAGGSPLHNIRQHLIPNVSGTVVTAATLQAPKLVLIEATWSFLGLAGAQSYSWGKILGMGLTLRKGRPPRISTGLGAINTLNSYWWIIVEPVVIIALTVFMLSLFGDALQSATDARSE